MSVQILRSIPISVKNDATFVDRIHQILELDERSLTENIVEALINGGRQALNRFEDDLGGRVFRTQTDPSSELSVLLMEKLKQELFNNVEEWFRTLLNEQQSEASTSYDEIFQQLTEHGLESLRENIYLSLTISLLFELDSNQLWQSLTTYGLAGLDRHQDDIPGRVFREQRNSFNGALYLSLTDYFRYSLNTLLQQCGFTFNESNHFDETLDSLVRYGLWNGLHKSQIRRLFGDRFETIENLIITNGLNDLQAEEEEIRLISNCLNRNQQMPLSALLSAGELIYMNTTFDNIFDEFIQQYQSTPDLPAFIHRCLTPIMYLLKRQYNLKDFLVFFQLKCDSRIPSERLSLRMLIDVLLQNADYSLSRKVISLLNERNPVPFIQPSNRFVSDVIHVWKYSSASILSFGIGKCFGKTTLLNRIFLTSFEGSVPSIYFRNTIDIDFGSSYIPCRSPNIADAHGPINLSLLMKISSLFDGFLIHIDYKYLINHFSIVEDYLKQIKHDKKFYRLIIRDVPRDQNQSCRTFLQSHFPSMKKSILPSIADAESRDARSALRLLCDELLAELPTASLDEPSVIRNGLRALMNPEYREHLDQLEQTINVLENTLKQIAENNLIVQNYFPEYSKFDTLCDSKLKLIRCHLFKPEDEQTIEQLRQEMLNARENFLQVEQKLSGIFKLFWNLLQTPRMIVSLEFLGTRLKQERTRIMRRGEMARKIPIEKSLSLEVLWRDAIVASEYRSPTIQQALQTHYYQYIQNGFPFEIIDGDNFFLQYQFLKKALAMLPQKRLLVVSVIGPQNSGKSTLFNYMFGSLFDVRDGRCTRGIYGSFIESNVPEFDQILLIDTEGLLSVERQDPEFDRQILLFCLALSHIVIVNVAGEITSTLQTLLTLSIDSLSKLGGTRIDRPMIYFILNQRAQMNLDNNSAAIESILDHLRSHHLDQFVQISTQSFHPLPMAFQNNGRFGSSDLRQTQPEFLQLVEKLGSNIIKSARDYFQGSNETWTILQWLSLVSTIFETLQQFPHLTRHCDLAERVKDEEIRRIIKTKLDEVSALKYENTPTENLQNAYDSRSVRIRDQYREELTTYPNVKSASDASRKRATDYLEFQIRLIFDAFQRSAMVDRYVDWIKSFIQNGNDDLRQLIVRQVDITEFDRSLSAMISPTNRNFSFSSNIIESLKFIYSSYHLCEFDYLLEYTYLIHYISLLNQTSLSIDQYKQRFVDHFVRLGYRYSSVKMEKLITPTAPRTIKFDNSVKYLNVNMFVRHSQQSQSTWTQRLSNIFSLSSQPIEQPLSLEYQSEIRRILQEQRLSTGKTSATIDEKQMLLSMRKIFQELIDRLTKINEEFDVKEIRVRLIPKVINIVNELIKEVEEELRPFCLILSRQLKSSLHTCAVMFLTKLYHDGQQQRIQKAFHHAEQSRDAMQRFYRSRIQSTQSNDEAQRGLLFSENIREHLRISYHLNAQQIIHQTINEHDQFSRRRIQEQCDQQLFLMQNLTWSLNYLRNPLQAIEEKFRDSWRRHIDTTVNPQLITLQSRYVQVIEEFFNYIEDFFKVISKFGDSSMLINDMFVVESSNSSTIYEHFLSKKRCFVLLLQNFLAERQITKSFDVDRTKYSLRQDIHDALNLLLIARQPSIPLSTLTKEMSKNYETLSIDHPEKFFQSLLGNKSDIIRFCQQFPCDFDRLDTRNTYQDLLKRVKGCSELCPCCNRPCDVDHVELPAVLKNSFITHACQYGHGLHAFTGKKFHESKDASLLMCDQVRSNANTTMKSISHSLNRLQLSYSNWTFQSQLNEHELEQSLSRWLLVWEKIGREICSQYNMTYVKRNVLN